MGDQPVARPLPTQDIRGTYLRVSKPRVGFETATPEKTFHASDFVAAVLSQSEVYGAERK
jgi:hypothetical protein